MRVLVVAMMIGVASYAACSTSSPSNGGSQFGADAASPVTDAGPIYVKPGQVPKKHYPEPVSCRTDRPPGVDFSDAGDAGGNVCGSSSDCCYSDADCTDGGINGRCESGRFGTFCSYDVCITNADCTAKKTGCACGDLSAASANACVPAQCAVDGDCGPGGFCSPSEIPLSCGIPQYSGIYCHTPNDQCYDDSDCPQDDSGYTYGCSFDEERGRWACRGKVCGG